MRTVERLRWLIGKRVIAWTGDREGDHGVVVEDQGLNVVLVRWDNDERTTPYRVNNLFEETPK